MRILYIISLVVFTSVLCRAQNPLPVLRLDSTGQKPVSLTPYMGLYTDESGEMTVDEMMIQKAQFESYDGSVQPYTYPTTHWLKVDVCSVNEEVDKWLVFKYPDSNYSYFAGHSFVDGYYFKKNELIGHHRTGYKVARSEKTIKERALVNALPLVLNIGDTISLFIRVQRAEFPWNTHLDAEIITPDPTISFSSDDYKWVILASHGAYLSIGIYILFFFVATRQKTYLFFALFAMFFSVHYLMIEPMGRLVDTMLYDYPQYEGLLFSVVMYAEVFLLLFGRYFTNLPERHPRWDKYLLGIIAVWTIHGLYDMVSSINPPYNMLSARMFGLILLVLLLPLCVRLVIDKHYASRVFAIGIFWFLFWNLIGVFSNLGIVNLPFNPWPIGQIGFLLIYGIGLGYNLMHTEKERAQAHHLKELDRVKSRFFANISHEFRTPLSLILGPINQASEAIPASDALDDEEEIPVKSKYLKVMKRNGLRLQNLVDQLLDLSKLDNGKMNLTVAKGNLIQFLKTLVLSFESKADQKDMRYNTSFPAQIEAAFYDADKLEKIVVNLLANAFKFTPRHGAITVTVEVINQELVMQISDSGPGISADEVHQIFNRFYQSEGSESMGTGIGLALVKELVDLYGGQISITSAQNEGTTFRLRLPYLASSFSADQIVTAEPSIHMPAYPLVDEGVHDLHEAPVTGEKSLILIVEDNPDLMQFIAENLSKEYDLLKAENGKKGLDKALAQVPDLIISDVMMPEMNGIELCNTLKTHDITSHIPIVLLTAKADRADKLEGLQHGADDYLTKPFDMRELKVRIHNLIDQRQKLRDKFGATFKVGPSEVQLNSVDERFLNQVMEEIEKNMSNEFYTVEELAAAVNFSRSQLNRKIKALTGNTSNQLIRTFRLERAKEMLEQNAASVSEIAYAVGYANLSYFAKSFKEHFGVLPSEVKVRV